MVYTSMLFALAFDKIVWNHTPGIWSIVGSSLILGSALFVAVQNQSTKDKNQTRGSAEEDNIGLVSGNLEEEEEEDGREGRSRPLRDVQEVQLRTMRL